ncbi:unnamed protein product [Oppiella nova]|uniref:Uncharacterized protein n=1 Tax=Oppiella nova TaxID=334625 RepID=A0A7R9QNY2_9ACAR|nr:unnamed protein product [Oppiella nova]CAG2168727.1 unnamed protein product [Oppiella nova]
MGLKDTDCRQDQRRRGHPNSCQSIKRRRIRRVLGQKLLSLANRCQRLSAAELTPHLARVWTQT